MVVAQSSAKTRAAIAPANRQKNKSLGTEKLINNRRSLSSKHSATQGRNRYCSELALR
ncbi:MAG: hypothetical protein F6J93_10395 [Oscillatoria sp. SIO1A7]|nr:hypothetical protein [Oscillatoria sp. SIO1A7]